MKKLSFFLFFLCVNISIFAQESVSVCHGQSHDWVVADADTSVVIYFHTDANYYSYNNERIYDTIVGNVLHLTPDASSIYQIISVDGVVPACDRILYLVVSPIPTISIPPASIHHVTCPDGAFYPYMDGSFHVDLDNPVQDYEWINISNDSIFFFIQTYDSVTLTGLRSGTYHVVARGNNGCEYHDSVTIEQPDPWGWDSTVHRIDTVCFGNTGCVFVDIIGGTQPYNYTWFYYSDTGQVFMPDTDGLLCGLYSRQVYYLYMYDSRGCKAFGDEIEDIFWYLYEYVEDSTHIITTDSIACYGRDFLVQAQSIGEGTYTWHVGETTDSINYWTSIYGDSMFVADYYTPPITEPTWIYAEFSDQHHCVTRDSIWVEVYNSEISLSVETQEIITDSTCTVHVSPPGGNLYVDDVAIVYDVPENYTFSTAGISVGEHILKYAGTFGSEIGLECEDEISIPIQVETNPFVHDWEYEISIYPNPATTTLNLTSTGISDFSVSIMDITGKVIKTEKMLDQTFTIDVSDLSSGMYMLHLVSDDGANKIVKFVKK